jgi:lipopolysaccharide biosynthesis glycosyltransferase
LKMLKGVKIIPQFGITTYFRLLAPALLPQDLDRVIYLDSDLVVEEDLANLWTLALGNAPMLAVQDYLLPIVSLPCALKETYQTLHLSPDAAYCNCGVMLINLKKWREEDLSRNVLEYTQEYYDYVYCADQDGINAVTCGKWQALDVRWNVQVFGAINPRLSLPHQSAELIKQAHILHFTTRLKPWHYNYRQAGSDRFAYYLRESNWLSSREYISWLLKVRLPQFAIHSLAIAKRILQKK